MQDQMCFPICPRAAPDLTPPASPCDDPRRKIAPLVPNGPRGCNCIPIASHLIPRAPVMPPAIHDTIPDLSPRLPPDTLTHPPTDPPDAMHDVLPSLPAGPDGNPNVLPRPPSDLPAGKSP